MAFDEYCKHAIFNPLRMKSTEWLFRDVDLNRMAVPYGFDTSKNLPVRYGFYGYPTYPDGALKTCVDEYARFLSVFINQGKSGDGKSLLAPETVKEMLTVRTFSGIDPEQSVGLAWHFDGQFYHHDGSDPGISTWVYFKPDTREGVIFFANGSDFDPSDIFVNFGLK